MNSDIGSKSNSRMLTPLIVPRTFPFQSDVITWLRPWHISRGGGDENNGTRATTLTTNEVNREEEGKTKQRRREALALTNYRMEQHHLLQLRSTFLSEALVSRGISIGPTITDICTETKNKEPEGCDWHCCLSTVDDPKSCLYSFDAEPNTKVIAPLGTTQYISLSALNRLRRIDPSKVEPMWHSKYTILKSWFSNESEYSFMQYVGWKGFLISTVLLDYTNGMLLKGLLLVLGVMSFSTICCLPILEHLIQRILISPQFWYNWHRWARIVHSALPLKLLIGQIIWRAVTSSFNKLNTKVREYIIDLECAILEDTIPTTVSSTCIKEEK